MAVITRSAEATSTDTVPIRPVLSRSARLRAQAVAGLALAVAMALQGPSEVFLYDAADYWAGSMALLEGGAVFDVGLLELRGALTPVVYLPAALIAWIVGDSAAADAVLAQNAVLIAVIGVFLIPRLVSIWRPVTPRVVWAGAVGTGLTLGGFAPHPLVDLWGVALLLAAMVAIDGRRRWSLGLAGLAGGLAINLRPAFLVPVVGVALTVLIGRRLGGLWFLAGAAAGLLPQAVMNRVWGVTWIPWPERTAELTGVQTAYAAFVVRYDTYVTDSARAQLFFCDPQLAGSVNEDYAESTGELAVWLLSHLPYSLLFAGQKAAASLHWPISAPYYAPGPGVNSLFAVLVTAVAVLGAAALLRATVRRGRRPMTLAQVAAVVTWVGSLLTLVTSATETRFALTLVLFGIAGCAQLAGDGIRRPHTRRGWAWTVLPVAAAVVVYGLGVSGMQHPVMGAVHAEICAAG